MVKADASVNITASGNALAFSTGSSDIGPDPWVTSGTTFTISPVGVATVFNSLAYNTFIRATFVANNLVNTTTPLAAASATCQFENATGPVSIGVVKSLRSLGDPNQPFTNEVYNTVLFNLAPGGAVSFQVRLTNTTLGDSISFPSGIDPCLLIIQRIA